MARAVCRRAHSIPDRNHDKFTFRLPGIVQKNADIVCKSPSICAVIIHQNPKADGLAPHGFIDLGFGHGQFDGLVLPFLGCLLLRGQLFSGLAVLFGLGLSFRLDLIISFLLHAGRIRFTETGIAKVKGLELQITLNIRNIRDLPAFERVSVGAEVSQVRIALRYIEDSDPGMAGRNIYVPRATLSPAGEAALKSRDEPQRLPLQLAIETPDDGLRQTYIDGVPA